MLKTVLVGLALGLVADAAWAQVQTVPLAIVSTTRPPSIRTIREVGGYPQRFSYTVGSGALILNAANQVTGYYFTMNDLEARTAYTYGLFSSHNQGVPTSCEGARNLTQRESAGELLLDLSETAPLTASNRGVAFIGSIDRPITLSEPIPLESIGYLYIQPVPEAALTSSEFCANVRLNPGGYAR
ncbi:hypothetical protein H6F67_05540 [Microcoleus sp. FACHB-1515]|uniref:hypothetical protein n=1 Tax=Cyanophyceae TaxID=3028117 RepID=UPI001684AD56|nr:hypothetical protein [Microcoleus sp. FACHB-1515]MBD2089314.1 hypothetical protein [Microcoleus sp. FACHB-1515]